MKKQDTFTDHTWTEEFENLYIITYQTIYRHAKLIFNQEDKAKELLILTYMEAYQRGEQLQKEKSPVDWLMKRADFLAETKLDATKEMLEDSYAEEKMQSKEAKKENPDRLDETSVLLEIEDRLGIIEDQEPEPGKGIVKTIIQVIISVGLLVIAIAALMIGLMKVRQQFDILQEPFSQTFMEASVENDQLGQNPDQKCWYFQIIKEL